MGELYGMKRRNVTNAPILGFSHQRSHNEIRCQGFLMAAGAALFIFDQRLCELRRVAHSLGAGVTAHLCILLALP